MDTKDVDLIKVFIAATRSEWLPMKVLEFSIRKHTSQPVQITPISSFERTIPIPQDHENQPRTPFSFQRFLIPELCNYQGKAIYLDADMQVFSDISDLFSIPFNKHDLLTTNSSTSCRANQFSVMLLDCQALEWNIDSIVDALDSNQLDYDGLMYHMKVANNIGNTIKPEWNSLEYFEKDITSLLHYTDMNNQPWVSYNNPNTYLWVNCLHEAITSDFISHNEINGEIKHGFIRPSLIWQLNNIHTLGKLPIAVKKLDKRFCPPYKKLSSAKSPLQRLLGVDISSQTQKIIRKVLRNRRFQLK